MKLLVFLLLLLPAAGISQDFTFNQGTPVEKNYYQEIPYETINGKLFLTCTIGGKPHRFLFDTGAPCTINKDLAAQLKLPVLNRVRMVDAYSHEDSTNTVQLNGLMLGNITFNQVPATTLFPDFYSCMNIDGVIGANILRNSIVRIDSKKHLITITDQEKKLSLKQKNSAPLVTNMGQQSDPQISFPFNKQLNLRLTFDSGDSQFMRLSDEVVGLLKPYHVMDSASIAYGATGLSAFGTDDLQIQHLYKVAPFTIGNAKFHSLVTHSNPTQSPAIGAELLDYGVLTLDFIHSKYYFDAYQADVALNNKRWNASYTYADGKLIIAIILKAAEGLVNLGDQVLNIDGVDCTQVTICDYVNKMWALLDDKETAQLTVKTKQGDIKKITINKVAYNP